MSNVEEAKRLVLPTSDHKVLVLNLNGDGI